MWESSKGKVHHQDYLTTDNFRVVLRRDDQFCLKVRQSGKCIYRPTIPQPDISEIVTMHRYQTFLKEDNNFKKHVTWFTSTSDETLSTVALFEYSGTFPNPQNKVNFIRTHPKTMNVIKEELKTKPPKQIYLDMNRNDSINAPKVDETYCVLRYNIWQIEHTSKDNS